MKKEIEELIEDVKIRRKSNLKKRGESMDSYQYQYCSGMIDEADYILIKLAVLRDIAALRS